MASVTVRPRKSGLDGSTVGIPRKIVDCTAPGRSRISTRLSPFGFGVRAEGGAPFFQPAKAVRIAFSMAASSYRPTT